MTAFARLLDPDNGAMAEAAPEVLRHLAAAFELITEARSAYCADTPGAAVEDNGSYDVMRYVADEIEDALEMLGFSDPADAIEAARKLAQPVSPLLAMLTLPVAA